MKRQLPEGSKVEFHHGRRVDGQIGTWYRKRKSERPDLFVWTEKGFTPSQWGGHTSCEVILPNGEVVWGVSDCRGNERYSKKIGREITLGRALKTAAEKHPELFQ